MNTIQYSCYFDDVIVDRMSSPPSPAEDMELDPQCRAVGGWRGPMAVARTSEETLTEKSEKMRSDEDSHWKIRFRKILGKI